MDFIDYTAEQMVDVGTICQIMDIPNNLEREGAFAKAKLRAKELKVLTEFNKLCNAALKEEKAMRKKKEESNITEFTDEDVSLNTGIWRATDDGVVGWIKGDERRACYHPIYPLNFLTNVQTGREKIRLRFKKNFTWKEVTVDKSIIASTNKIVSLADFGISVTSENAKDLVKYLSDVENLNIGDIEVKNSTSKLGWIRGLFVPYDVEIDIDSEQDFKEVLDSINKKGSRQKWYETVREIRKEKRFEPKIYIAAALASILLEPLNALPFIVNLWGESGKGKTVALMVAASIYANPRDFLADPRASAAGFEVRNSFLNNFPILIDDLSQVKDKYEDDFSTFIYMLCSGSGKTRSNVRLGLNARNTWTSAILTNNEHSIITETMQGGAVNRVIDVEMGDGYIFKNGNKLVETLRQNYGFCGEEWIELIKSIGFDEIKKVRKEFEDKLFNEAQLAGVKKEEKQIIPMSIILTADKLATDHLFNDGEYLDFKTCFDLLKDANSVSENQRTYDYIVAQIGINKNNFIIDGESTTGREKGQIWGKLNTQEATITKPIFDELCVKANNSSRTFLAWAKKRELIRHSKNKNTKSCRISGIPQECVILKLPTDASEDNEFVEVSEGQIPFNFV